MIKIANLQNGLPIHDRGAHVHHAVARHGGRRRVVDVVRLEDDLAVGRHGDAVTIGQGQRLVVVKHAVQVLNPDGVHWPVQDDPDVFTLYGGQWKLQ